MSGVRFKDTSVTASQLGRVPICHRPRGAEDKRDPPKSCQALVSRLCAAFLTAPLAKSLHSPEPGSPRGLVQTGVARSIPWYSSGFLPNTLNSEGRS